MNVPVSLRLKWQDLGLEPFQVQRLMREGKLTSRFERGVDEDDGRYRLTFFHGGRQPAGDDCLARDRAHEGASHDSRRTMRKFPWSVWTRPPSSWWRRRGRLSQ